MRPIWTRIDNAWRGMLPMRLDRPVWLCPAGYDVWDVMIGLVTKTQVRTLAKAKRIGARYLYGCLK